MADLIAKHLIRNIPNFPEPGIVFKDITPVLGNGPAFQEVIDQLVEWAEPRAPDAIAAIESRGFLLGAPVALALGLGMALIRKAGKLPHQTIRQDYSLEYGTNTLEIHRDAVQSGQRVLVIDDLLATGGTALAAAQLVEALGGTVVGFSFLVELGALNGRSRLSAYDLQALITD